MCRLCKCARRHGSRGCGGSLEGQGCQQRFLRLKVWMRACLEKAREHPTACKDTTRCLEQCFRVCDLYQEMGASRVLTMQIAGESLLNAPSPHCWRVLTNVCLRCFTVWVVLSLIEDGVAIVVWLVFFDFMKGCDGDMWAVYSFRLDPHPPSPRVCCQNEPSTSWPGFAGSGFLKWRVWKASAKTLGPVALGDVLE